MRKRRLSRTSIIGPEAQGNQTIREDMGNPKRIRIRRGDDQTQRNKEIGRKGSEVPSLRGRKKSLKKKGEKKIPRKKSAVAGGHYPVAN